MSKNLALLAQQTARNASRYYVDALECLKLDELVQSLVPSPFTPVHLNVPQQPDKDAKHDCHVSGRIHYDLACGN